MIEDYLKYPEIKEHPYTSIGKLTLGEAVIELYKCRVCDTVVSLESSLRHYKKHYPQEKAVTIPSTEEINAQSPHS